MTEALTTILIPCATILLSSAVLNFVQFLINRRDAQKKAQADAPISKLEKRLDKLEEDMEKSQKESDLRDSRTQLLILMNHFPTDQFQLLELAHHYFVDLHGDWWMSSMFKAHCQTYAIPLPEWFMDDTERR